jgi:hypothetical protein
MTGKKYQLHHQYNGTVEVETYEEAKQLQAQFIEEWFEINRALFVITVLVSNEDGTVTQGVADENGNLFQAS